LLSPLCHKQLTLEAVQSKTKKNQVVFKAEFLGSFYDKLNL
jgi:hypothetical protein